MNLFRCDDCGKFISYCDLENGKASHRLVTPDSAYTREEWETLCARHSSQWEENKCRRLPTNNLMSKLNTTTNWANGKSIRKAL
jgi:hypothetical protein